MTNMYKMEHPGCPTGCVAVATAQIMINCKKKFLLS